MTALIYGVWLLVSDSRHLDLASCTTCTGTSVLNQTDAAEVSNGLRSLDRCESTIGERL